MLLSTTSASEGEWEWPQELVFSQTACARQSQHGFCEFEGWIRNSFCVVKGWIRSSVCRQGVDQKQCMSSRGGSETVSVDKGGIRNSVCRQGVEQKQCLSTRGGAETMYVVKGWIKNSVLVLNGLPRSSFPRWDTADAEIRVLLY